MGDYMLWNMFLHYLIFLSSYLLIYSDTEVLPMFLNLRRIILFLNKEKNHFNINLMTNLIKKIVLLVGIFSLFFFLTPRKIRADENIYSNLQITPIPCGCLVRLNEEIYRLKGESCTNDFEEFRKDPINQHFWIRDPKITEQGKADERARQFIYWVITHPSIDNHPTIINIWKLTRNIAYFFLIFIVALFGLGYIIGQRTNFDLGIKIWPSIYKTLLLLLYITFSATIIIFLIQISDILMKFFIENLKGDQLFNIYFSGPQSAEESYSIFYGCRDLNFNVQEAANAELFLLQATNITYYVMGTMLILRKVILWFMLFVSPFLALLIPFIFIRNTGWIWIGVFFQWLFYGPLFALFLGALAEIWRRGIPFSFDFSRAETAAGHIFPTAINIFYGGPAQGNLAPKISLLNNGNYIDTFAEYVISLIMLWAVIFFPWWLLRIFRDYCCDGIYAAKNILLSIYDQIRGGPTPPPSQPSISPSTISTALKIPKEVEIPVKVKLETIEEIKKAKTEEIARSITFEAKKLTDIAHFETNKQIRETVTKNINYLKNPLQAETPTERQKFMNLKTEIYQRAVKQDVIAKNIVSAISNSSIEQQRVKEEILKTTPRTIPVTQLVTNKTNFRNTQTILSTTQSFFNSIANNNSFVNQIAKNTNLTTTQVQSVVHSLKNNLNQPVSKIINNITNETKLDKEKVISVINNMKEMVKTQEHVEKVIKEVEEKVNLPHQEIRTITNVVNNTLSQSVVQPITLPPVSLIKTISNNTNKNEETILSTTQSFFNSIANNNSFVNQIAKNTNLTTTQVQSVVHSLKNNLNQPVSKIINNITNETKLDKEKVISVINNMKEMVKTQEHVERMINEVAKNENIEVEKMKEIIKTPIDVITAPERNIEQAITVPPTVSIDEYEQVKKMWADHYQRGELPLSENINNRKEWVERDIVLITNTLNKLLSDDPKLKQEGLDDISYILPIVLINNLSGEQLIAYLKAKVEAAKQVKELFEKEEEVRQKLKEKAEEEKIPVEVKKKAEAAKQMEMQMEMEDEKNKQSNNNQ